MRLKASKCEESMLKREIFEDNKSYNYFKRGLMMAKKIQGLKDSGCIIFHKKAVLEGDFYFRLDEDGNFPVLGTAMGDNGISMWLGSTMGNIEKTVYVYKKELDLFNGFSYVDPKHRQKIE